MLYLSLSLNLCFLMGTDSLFPHLHTPFSPFSPSLISLIVSVDVKHYVYLEEGTSSSHEIQDRCAATRVVQRLWCSTVNRLVHYPSPAKPNEHENIELVTIVWANLPAETSLLKNQYCADCLLNYSYWSYIATLWLVA